MSIRIRRSPKPHEHSFPGLAIPGSLLEEDTATAQSFPNTPAQELSRGLAALKEQNLPDGHFSDRVWAADTQASAGKPCYGCLQKTDID